MKYYRACLLLPLLLCGCNLLPKQNTDSNNSHPVTTNDISQSDGTESEEYIQPTDSDYSSEDYTPSTTESEDDYINGRQVLPCGYVKLDKPTNSPINITTSNDSSAWWSIDIKDELDDSLTFIYGNSSSKGPSGHYANAPMYSYNAQKEDKYPGGLKMSQRSVGIQSPLFSHSGPKLEIRIGISQVNEAGGSVEKGKPTGFIYFYNSNGDFLANKTINVVEGTIVKNTAGNYIRYYDYSAQDIAYFEFRLNALPYKSSQNYNFGIGYLSIHSWPQV